MITRSCRAIVCLTALFVLAGPVGPGAPDENDIRKAMWQATDFMMNTVSQRGGFVWKYTADLSEQWGEVPARKSMIWVQDPGTVGVGNMLLNVYRATGDRRYLDEARRVANALIWGQHPSGGWHYFIDFDMSGVPQWYADVASKCWGWSEYYRYYGNATFDDEVSAGATRFLLNLYMTTLEPAYRAPLLKALDFILQAQYPNGGWPQRYPRAGETDYTAYYTFNDNIVTANIFLLLDAADQLGNDEYKKAAYRGMDFVVTSQLPKPQAGWAQQYDLKMKPAPAREYEPAAVATVETLQCIRDLEIFYMVTGDRRYLQGIPDAIGWLENSILPENHNRRNPSDTHAVFYEPGTNKPLYAHREGTDMKNGRYWIDDKPKDFLSHYGAQINIDLAALKKEYERVGALTPGQAMAEHRRNKSAPKDAPGPDHRTVEKILSSMDARGAWIEQLSIPDFTDVVHNPPRKIQGIGTATYIRNMTTLADYLKNLAR